MKRILIAYDGSAGAETAVRDLIRAGLPVRAEAKVVTMADVWLPPALADGLEVFSAPPGVAKAHKKAAEVLRSAKKTAIQGAQLVHELFPEWTITNSARPDSPAWGILAEATRWRADLIVIGSHGRTPLQKFFLGSVSLKVAAEAPCSVRIVRPRPETSNRPARILIGLDGSKDSLRAADQVLHRRWGAGTQVELVTVVDENLRSRIFAKPGVFEDFAADPVEDTIQSLLETTRAEFARREFNVHCHTFEGDPKTALLRNAADWNADCIFLGARGIDHGHRLYLGTLASAVCSRAHCTVEIVRARSNAVA